MATTAATRPAGLADAPAQLAAHALGLGCGMLAFAMFSVMDALIKWLSAAYPIHQLVFSNAVFALVPVLLWAWRSGGFARLRTRRLGLHVLRGGLGVLGGFLGFYAYSRMPLTDAYAIIFTTPLLITALSVPVLGERVGWRRWSAVVIGFLGVLVMLRPDGAVVGTGPLAAFGAACCSACSILIVRRLSTTESTAGIALYSSLTVATVMGAWLAVDHVVPRLADLALFAAAGLIGGSALIVLITAYRRAPAALVAPFQYTQMIWGTLLGLALWGDVPDRWVVLGAAIVAASGLFVLYRETRLGRRPTASLHPSTRPPREPLDPAVS